MGSLNLSLWTFPLSHPWKEKGSAPDPGVLRDGLGREIFSSHCVGKRTNPKNSYKGTKGRWGGLWRGWKAPRCSLWKLPPAKSSPFTFWGSRWPGIYPERMCVLQERVKVTWVGLHAHGQTPLGCVSLTRRDPQDVIRWSAFYKSSRKQTEGRRRSRTLGGLPIQVGPPASSVLSTTGSYFFFYLFIYFLGLATQHVGSQFPNEGSHPCPLHWKHSLNHWTARKVPGITS